MAHDEDSLTEWSDRAALSDATTLFLRSTVAAESSSSSPSQQTSSTTITATNIQEKEEHDHAALSTTPDEGMGVFSWRSPTTTREDNVNPLLQQARMLLFRANEYHSRRDYDAAFLNYQQALDAATTATAAAATAATSATAVVASTVVNAAIPAPKNNHCEDARYILIPSLTNIGILCFHHRQWTLAAAYLELAMTHCMQFWGNDSYELAHILNCTGVVLYQSAMSVFSQSEADVTPAATAVAAANANAALFFWHEAHRIATLFTTFQSQRRCEPASSNTQLLATIGYNLGRLLMHQTSYTEALLYFGMAWQQRSDLLGAAHLDTVACVFGLGQVYHFMGRDDNTALMFYKRAIESEAFQRSNQYRDYLVALLCVTEIYEQRGDSTAAKASIDQILVVTRRMLQSSQPQSQSQRMLQYPQRESRQRLEIGALITRMARFYLGRQQHDVALELYRESLSIMTSVAAIPQHDPHIIATMLLISEIHHSQKDYSAALHMALQALERQKLQYGECSVAVACSLRWIGSLHGDYDDLDGALQYYQDALILQRTLHGDDSLQVSDALTDVGAVLCKSEKTHEALNVLTAAWEIRIVQLGRDHHHVSFSVCNIGVCHMMQGSYTEAISCFAETLRVEQIVLGDCHRDVALTLNRLGDAHKKNGNAVDALPCIQRALSIERVVLCHEPTMIAATLNQLGNLHLALGDVASMMTAMIESARLFLSAGRDFSVVIVTSIPPLYDSQLCPAASAA